MFIFRGVLFILTSRNSGKMNPFWRIFFKWVGSFNHQLGSNFRRAFWTLVLDVFETFPCLLEAVNGSYRQGYGFWMRLSIQRLCQKPCEKKIISFSFCWVSVSRVCCCWGLLKKQNQLNILSQQEFPYSKKWPHTLKPGSSRNVFSYLLLIKNTCTGTLSREVWRRNSKNRQPPRRC